MTVAQPLVSICIATRDRKNEVLVALESCFAQTYRPVEVLLFDDASTDGTAEAVRDRFPKVRILRQSTNLGIAEIRKIGLQEARGEFVFSVDDDAYYTDRSTVAQAVRCFQEHPEAAVIAMRYIEPRRRDGPGECDLSPDGKVVLLSSFISCAYGIRRAMGLQVGNYRGYYFYRGEEGDLAIRLLERGYSIIYLKTPPVVHLYSPIRAWDQMTPLGIRNTFLFTVLNVPTRYLLPRLSVNAFNLFRYKLSPAEIPRRSYQVVAGLMRALRFANNRRPVSRATFGLYRRLPRHGPEPAAPFGDFAPLRLEQQPEPNLDSAGY